MPETNIDTILGKLVVENHLCTEQDLRQCLNMVRKMAQQGNPRTLSDILISEGCATQKQLDRVKNSIEKSRADHRIPGFQILDKLGAGAMATVYMARQLSLDRIVAVKILPKRLSENPEYVERFYKEGRAAAKLNHNNIVQAIDVGEAGGYHYFVMEYVKGKTVYDDLIKYGAYSEQDALDIIVQVAEALEHAHNRGLIHRDVKPKNVMITEGGVAKLADMGLAREASDVETAQMEAGRAYGTPYYISPEQIRGEVDIGFATDIYSLGAMFYHMVTGRVPFEADTPSAVMHKHLKETLVPPDHLSTDLSVGVAEVIEVMMAKKPEDRYRRMKLVLEDLRSVRAGESPMHAHKMFDTTVLTNLEKNSPESVTYDLPNLNEAELPLGIKMLIIILTSLLIVSFLIIVMLLNKT